MEWTGERKEAFIRLWNSGFSCLQIANNLGVTRNAVAGIAHRLRAAGRIDYRLHPGRPIQTQAEKNEKQRLRRQRRIEALGLTYISRKRMPRIKPQPIIPRIPKKVEKPNTEGVTILARKGNECAYPIAHRLFCGAPTCSIPDEMGNILPTSWCEYHWIVCHRREPKGKAA